ncbi:hypothetical protein HYFRA_00010017 [Hymenoscyphus fraxineus]|uniref:Uncharacterized protein n=1 Tax=Hymenoscyphus fraxineus TaxID=746836 RepID=A0A9N9KU75_9HELO|nr:hypothetical protein HYFRA_00010017 [Hymenoscyphus fraxineus]
MQSPPTDIDTALDLLHLGTNKHKATVSQVARLKDFLDSQSPRPSFAKLHIQHTNWKTDVREYRARLRSFLKKTSKMAGGSGQSSGGTGNAGQASSGSGQSTGGTGNPSGQPSGNNQCWDLSMSCLFRAKFGCIDQSWNKAPGTPFFESIS